ncbi:MAG: hypothetical protein A3H97_11690 [Acidobacteria bacterium RIFCSPLOWO2_02_FULL_65_29]|nr:MAG: hypothetical protein A3H97_11690 [Acidobacteria bacterium RIFCSPLOWO2_02_FULL_65_29]
MNDVSRTLSQPQYSMTLNKDVPIKMRDGAIVYADVYRPQEEGAFPALVNISVYQKDKVWIPPPDLEEEGNPYMSWETANPLWWVPRGYACVRVDSRGSGKSPGHCDPGGWQETLDYYDAIEWTGRQPWCSGKVAGMGISYHACAQWRVAGLKPPSLKAIIPWEGWGDGYRDAAYHGGIFAMGFIAHWHAVHMANHLLGRPQSYNPDAFHTDRVWQYMRHSLNTGWWSNRSAHWGNIECPLYAVGNWAGVGLHLRGATEGYTRAASTNKKLRIHSGTHYHPFYSEDGRLDQLRFLDHWLKGLDTGIVNEPPVKLQIRTGGEGNKYEWRFENEWPIARTQWTRYYLHVGSPQHHAQHDMTGSLSTKPAAAARTEYAATAMGRSGAAAGSASAPSHTAGNRHSAGVSFVTEPMKEDTEVTGPIALNVWVSSTTEDMDIFATIRNIGPDGQDIFELGPHGQPVPVTKGWLRASHRKLDETLSLPYRPYHTHDERWPLTPGELVECRVEIWPTSMVFRKGHRIRLDIQPFDGIGSSYTHYHAEYNGGTNAIYVGRDTPSYLLLPLVPRR